MAEIGSKIDVEEIMNEIRREIIEKGYKNEDIAFSDVPVPTESIIYSNTLEGNIRLLQNMQNVFAYRILKSNSVFGSLKTLIKKVIRKLVKFYVEPIVSDQNKFNELAVHCIMRLYMDMELMQQRIKLLEEENKKL